jgi:hypothetical protein
MSDMLAQIIERASTDAQFRAQLQSNPEAALAGYQLTAEEKAALMSADPARLDPLGVDVRNTKQASGTGSGMIEIDMPTSAPFAG